MSPSQLGVADSPSGSDLAPTCSLFPTELPNIKDPWHYKTLSLPTTGPVPEKQQAQKMLTEEGILCMLENRKFSAKKPVSEPAPRFCIAGKSVSTPGNLTSIIAQAKAGKTALVGAFLAAVCVADARQHSPNDCSSDEDGLDTLGITATAPEKMAVIHFDTEQSEYDHYRCVMRALQRANLTIEPSWFHSYRCGGMDTASLVCALDMIVQYHHKTDGIFAIILDGCADFVADSNNLPECQAFVAHLMDMANQYHCSIIGVIHENAGLTNTGSGKGRGHLGSELERKAESNICLKRKDGVTIVHSNKMRGAPIFESDGPCFAWSDDHGRHMSTTGQGKAIKDSKRVELEKLARSIFAGKENLSHKEICELGGKIKELSPKSMERWHKKMKDLGIIRDVADGKWALAQ